MRYYSPDELSREKLQENLVCRYEIDRTEVDNQDFQRLDDFFEELKEYGSLARQKVIFSFAGFDDDKRELIYIPEAVSYARAMIKSHPYFWYYAIQLNSEFFYLAFFVNEKNMTVADYPAAKSFFIKQDADAIMKFVQVMAINLNIYGEEIGDIDGSVECLKLWSEKIIGRKL